MRRGSAAALTLRWSLVAGPAASSPGLIAGAGFPGSGVDDRAKRLGLPLEAAADQLAEREDRLVDDPVVREVPLLAARDDSRALEHAEMLGDVLLRRARQLGQLEHGRLALAVPVEKRDSRRLAEGAKPLGDQL